MIKFVLVVILTFLSTCLGWNVTLEPYDPIPMYECMNISVRLFLDAEDQKMSEPLTLTVSLMLREDDSWAVTLLTDHITFDSTDIR